MPALSFVISFTVASFAQCPSSPTAAVISSLHGKNNNTFMLVPIAVMLSPALCNTCFTRIGSFKVIPFPRMPSLLRHMNFFPYQLQVAHSLSSHFPHWLLVSFSSWVWLHHQAASSFACLPARWVVCGFDLVLYLWRICFDLITSLLVLLFVVRTSEPLGARTTRVLSCCLDVINLF